MDEKILNKNELARKFQDIILNEKVFSTGRNNCQIKFIDGEWQIILITPDGHEYKWDMMVNTLLYHISTAEKA